MKLSDTEYIQLFEEYLLGVRRYSVLTAKAYREDITHFKAFLEREDLGDFCDVSSRVAKFYYAELKEVYQAKSIARKISTLKAFYHFLLEESVLDVHPFLEIKYPKNTQKLPQFIYAEDIDNLFASIEKNTDKGRRNAVIIELLYATGMRVSEAANLKVRDIELAKRTMLVHGKGQKDRIIPFSNRLKETLEAYLLSTRKNLMKQKEHGYLLVSLRGEKLSERGLRYIIKEVLEQSALMLKVTPHTLRHSFASHMISNGADLRSVQELLGHENISSTQIYTKITSKDLQDKYLKAHPRARRK